MTATSHSEPDLPARLPTRLATLSVDPPAPDRADAAVLVLLRPGSNGLEVLAEQRVERTTDPWSGQVGLPGGRREPTDQSLTETVLRELREEVGLSPSSLEGPPRLFDIRRARPAGLRVAVFAGLLSGTLPGPTEVDANEVASTFWFPLQALAQIETRPRETMFGQVEVEVVVFEGHVVWGFTLRALRDFVAWLATPDGTTSRGSAELNPWRGQAV